MTACESALELAAAGLSVIPIKADGSKAPALPWKPYQSERIQPEAVARFFTNGSGIGVVGGAVSGNLEILDVEGRADQASLVALINEAAPGLLDRLPCVSTPSGGLHLFYRCEDAVEGNQKLACSANADGRPEVLIETRGEGGYVIAPGSPAACHPSGKPYRLVSGQLDQIPTLTARERAMLLACARSFNSYAAPEKYESALRADPGHSEGKPGVDYAQRADVLALLEKHGWTVEIRVGDEVHVRRPGKKHGISAVWNHGGYRLLYVFSSNAAPFEPERGYNAFSIYGLLEHGGDFRAAARQLAAEGYGDTPMPQRLRKVPQTPLPELSASENRDGQHPLEDFRCTDLGNAHAFAERNSDRLKYCHALDAWFVWDGRRWKRDADGGVYRLAEEQVRQLYAEASRITDERRRKEIASWAIRCEDRRKLDAMLALAKHQAQLVVSSDALDANHWLLTVANGTVDLRTGKLLPHDPAHLITKLAPVNYDPMAAGPVFRAFLDRTFDADADTKRFVQKAVGYSLTGDTSEQCLLLCHGSGANGKSTFLSAVQSVLGDYALSTPTDTLLAKRDAGGIPNDVARLQGSRFVSALETEDGKRLAESRIKTMTGGDRITARYMRGEWFEFDATFKLWLATNHKPEIQGTDHAVWRRIRLIPFNVTIPDDERDAHLLDKLKAEAPAILAWAIVGCLDWQRNGLKPPESVASATAEYRSESDVLGAFLEECCALGAGFTVKASRLYSEYKGWADRNGETVITNAAFGRRMVDRGFAKKKTKSGILYDAIGIAMGEGFGPGE